MIKNYFKTAWRTILGDRTYAGINILGLTIGLTACMLVGTVVLDDRSYDQSWTQKDELYRIVTVDTTAGMEGKDASAFANLSNALKDNFPEVLAASSIHTSLQLQLRMEKGDDQIFQMDVVQADTNVWQMLDIQVTAGHPQQFVAGVGNLVISEHFRDLHFPNEDPVGKTIYASTYSEDAVPYQITGVVTNLPNNSYLRADGFRIISPIKMELNREGWGFYDEQLILVRPNTDMTAFGQKANNWYRTFVNEASDNTIQRLPKYEFQPIKDIYLHSDFAHQRIKGNAANIYIFSVITVLLLAIACINFVNLSSARAIRRLRETGVRKVLGATRGQLVAQFLTESLLFFCLSTLMAFILYAVSYAWLESFIGHKLSINLLYQSSKLLPLLAIVLLCSLATGAYPAWAMSSLKSNHALRGRTGQNNLLSATGIRNTLVAAQFSIAILILISMVTVWKQVNFMQEKPLGYTPDHILSVRSFALGEKGESLRHALSQLPSVDQVSFSRWVPTQGSGSMSKRVSHPDNANETQEVFFIGADTQMPSLLDFKLESGRLFDARERNSGFTLNQLNSSETEENTLLAKALITTTTANLFGLKESDLGRPLNELGITPIGIISDFHSVSLHDPIKPIVILPDSEMMHAYLLVKALPGQEQQTMQSVAQAIKEFYPGKPINMEWVDDLLTKQYEKEAKQMQLFSFFGLLALLLAALGVFGLVVHATQQRVKEIGIRKVLGASVSSIVAMLSKDFVKLVCFAIVIASPFAWWAMNQWLADFAYRIEIQWWMFVLAGLVALAVALLTVATQAIRAAVANPVDSLRDE